MSQRRQDARRAKQERRRQERHEVRATQRTPNTTTARPAAAAAPAKPSFWSTRNKLIIFGGAGGIIVILLAWWIIGTIRAPLPGEQFESQGNDHLANIDDPHPEYNTNPATSGWHLPPIPRPGIYTQPKVNEELGHFMEHGGVWVLYNCPDGCPEDVSQLERIVNSAIDDGDPTALAPFPTMDSKFALVSWQYLLTLDEVDSGQVEEFISRHACRYNPEGPGYCPVARGEIKTTQGDDRPMTTLTPTPTSVFESPSPAATPTPAR
ncbi:MAG: DUF3105 domain-containing protein [Dehalococcoidia bacterium]